MIINKAKLALPNFMADDFFALCRRANIVPSEIDLIIKRRNRYTGNCWRKKGNRDMPNGTYFMDYRTISIRVGRNSHPNDIKFVLAHEIGHLVDHLRNRCNARYYPTEKEATKFALACNCYPNAKYGGVKSP